MKYYYQIEGNLRNNLGDVLQGIVAKKFLPSDAEVVDRENLASIDMHNSGYFIANGWYMHNFDNFPPPENVIPLYLSVHIASSQLLKNKSVRDHFKKHSPIGCRDEKTKKLFLGWGIPAYYSGCLTITTTKRNEINNTDSGECLLVDNIDHPVPENVKIKLEELLGEELTRVSHDPPDATGSLRDYNENATKRMEYLLDRYCKARIIITTKIHCALPCLGMGANVFIIHPNPDDPRLNTVREFIEVKSYKEVLKLKEIGLPEVNIDALNDRKEFLSKIIERGINSNSNPIATSNEYRYIKSKSQKNAKRYKLAVSIMRLLGVKKQQIKKVYG